MKLNNYGWGMKEMILFMSVLLLFLLLAVYNVNKLYRAIEHSQNNIQNVQVVHEEEKGSEIPEVPVIKEEPLDKAYYKNLEVEFRFATLSYLKQYNYDLSSTILKVTYSTLNGLKFLEMEDQYGKKTCDGYSNVYYDEDIDDYVIKSFIKCGNYSTEGY